MSQSRRTPKQTHGHWWRRIHPVIRARGIDWRGGDGVDPLLLVLEFENRGDFLTRPTRAVVRVAAFGAFLDWTPLIEVNVPSIAPGERVTVTVDAEASEHENAPLPILLARGGSFGGPAVPELSNAGGRTALDVIRSAQLQTELDTALRPQHFAGNIDVFVSGESPVERHLNRSNGLRPGHDNFAFFGVGDSQPDVYTFRLDAESDWDVTLPQYELEEPVKLSHGKIRVHIRPPAKVLRGRITIWVTRKSSGQEVAVEFELSVDA